MVIKFAKQYHVDALRDEVAQLKRQIQFVAAYVIKQQKKDIEDQTA